MAYRWTKVQLEVLDKLLERFPPNEITRKAKSRLARTGYSRGRPEYVPEYASTIWLCVEQQRRLPPGSIDQPLSWEEAAETITKSIASDWKKPIGLNAVKRLYKKHQSWLDERPEIRDFCKSNIEFIMRTNGKGPMPRFLSVSPLDPKQWQSTKKKTRT
jgi:hypothetical protein